MAEASKVREEQPVASTPNNEAASSSAATSSAVTTEDKSKKESPSSPTVTDSPKTTPEIGEALLERLARQVEYYFSSANLSKDTYVSTLRSLNDGYVPISIIANFGKVKSLVQYDAINAVRMAATEFSELLEVVEIDTQTGKRVVKKDETDRSSDVPLIAAVGPISGEPIPISVIPAAPATPPAVNSTAPIQNTVIIREVPEGTEESHIRQLFTFDSCPSIESLHLDVANCWFVTLNTSSRDDMVNVMFELRKMKFQSGEPVLARLKSGVVLSAVSQPFIPAMFPSVPPPSAGYNNGSRKNKKKKNNNSNSNNGKSRQGGNGNNQNKNGGRGGGKNGGNPRSRNNNGKQQKKSNNGQTRNNSPSQERPSEPQTPPTLGEEHFPTLPSEEMSVNKIEVEKVPEEVARDSRPEDDSSCDDLGKPKAHSDSGSTATTASSSSSSKLGLGGYAAALKKAAPPKPVEPAPRRVSEKKQSKKSKEQTMSKEGETAASQNLESTVQAPVVDSVGVEPPSWGGGRTFASLLRKESKGAASEQAAV